MMTDSDALVLETRLGRALTARGWTLAVAKSCTGGLLGHRLTQVPGSSTYLLGGVISYSNQSKHELLGVNLETLASYGAVSQETAIEMARGACQALHANVGVSITCIAGPDGATAGKPVGLTWIAVVTPEAENIRSFVYKGTRSENKHSASQSALELCLAGIETVDG